MSEAIKLPETIFVQPPDPLVVDKLESCNWFERTWSVDIQDQRDTKYIRWDHHHNQVATSMEDTRQTCVQKCNDYFLGYINYNAGRKMNDRVGNFTFLVQYNMGWRDAEMGLDLDFGRINMSAGEYKEKTGKGV